MTQPQQHVPHAQAAVNQSPAPAQLQPSDTVYLDAEVIDAPSRTASGTTRTRQVGNTTFTTFTWSSVNGFERGWNSAFQEKHNADPFANGTPTGGPQTSKAAWKRSNLLGGAAQTVIGGAIALVGIPMLILPGPGLLAIGLGGVLAAGGIKKILGR